MRVVYPAPTEQKAYANVRHFGARGNGVSDDSPAFQAALDKLMAANGGTLEVPAPDTSYLLNSAVTATSDEGKNIRIIGRGAATIRTDVENALVFSGSEKLSTTLEAQATVGTRTLTLASTTGIKTGDILIPTIPLIAETTWHREMSETHVISRVVDATTVEIANPLEFTFLPQADLRWTADGTRTSFWYRSYFVPQAQVEVLLGGVVQSSGFTITPRSANSNNFGFDVAFATAPANGTEVRIRNTQKINVKVYRSGRLSIENLKFSSPDGCKFIQSRYMLSPQFRNLRFESDTNSVLGDYLWLIDCVNPVVRNVSIKYGRYAIFVQRTRDADIENVVGHDGWHLVSCHGFSVNTHIRRVWGYRCYATVDVHQGLNTHMRDCFGYDEQAGINNRGAGGSMVNVHIAIKDTANTGFTNGILWTQDGDLDGPYSYRPYMVDFYLERCSFKAPNASVGFPIYINQADHVVFDRVITDGSIGTAGSFANIGIKRMSVRDCDVAAIEPRLVSEEAVIEGSSIGQIRWSGVSATNPILTAYGSTFSHATAIATGGDTASGIGYRRFFGCRFYDADNLIDASGIGTGIKRKAYVFEGCTFDGIGAFDANIRANGGAFSACEYVGGTANQERGTAAPTTGTWAVGNIFWNSAPAASGFMGWVCVTAGTPGTWKTFGAISA